MLTKVSSTQRVAFEILIKALRTLSSIKVGSKHHAYFVRLCEDALKAIDKWFLDQLEEKGIPVDLLPEDFSITGLVTGTIRKFGLRGADVEEVQAEVLSSLPDWLDRFDPERGKLTTMLITNTRSRVLDYIAKQKKEREHTAPIITEEEEGAGVPGELLVDIRDTAETESEYHSLLRGIRDFLYKKKERFGKVFDMLLEGKTGKQIQEFLGVSRGYISQITESIRQSIVDFAQQEGNPDLESAAQALKKKYFVHSSKFGSEFLPIVKEASAEGIDLSDRAALLEFIESRNATKARTYLSSCSSGNFKDLSRFLKEYIKWAK